MQGFDEILPVRGHVLLDRHARRHVDVIEIEADPSVVVALPQDPDERREVHAAGAEPLIDRVGRLGQAEFLPPSPPLPLCSAPARPAFSGAPDGQRVLEVEVRDAR